MTMLLESGFWPRADVQKAVQSFSKAFEGPLKESTLAAFIRVGDSVLEMEELGEYETDGSTLQVTVFMRDQLISGEDPSSVAWRELKSDASLWRGKERGVFVRPITVPFRQDIQTLEQAVKEFIDPKKDYQIYPLVQSQ